MIALQIIGYSLAVMIIVAATFLLFIGGPTFRHRRPPERRRDAGDAGPDARPDARPEDHQDPHAS